MSRQPPNSEDLPTVASLEERRRQHNLRLAQSLKRDTTRLTELEAELSRMLDILGDLSQRLEAQDRYLHRLLELMKQERGRERRG